MNSGIVLSNNTVTDGTGIRIHGNSSNVLVELNTVRNCTICKKHKSMPPWAPIDVASTVEHVLLRANVLVD
jgi:hypothetical protein